MRNSYRSILKKSVSCCFAGGSLLLCLGITSCSSDDDEPTGTAGKGGSTANGGSSAGSSSTSGGSAAAGASGGTNASGTAGTSGAGNGSEACVKYCACYQQKCAGFVDIPGGATCSSFCATFENQPFFGCRQSMCDMSGGPAVNNNDHCQHMLGLGQCN